MSKVFPVLILLIFSLVSIAVSLEETNFWNDKKFEWKSRLLVDEGDLEEIEDDYAEIGMSSKLFYQCLWPSVVMTHRTFICF